MGGCLLRCQGRRAVSNDLLLLALAAENAELSAHLAEVQDQCVELVVDVGKLNAEIEALRRDFARKGAEADNVNLVQQ